MSEAPLHPSIVAMISLSAGIAAKHPAMGLCQLQKLRDMGVPEEHIAAAIEIARHIRDEAAQKIDGAFDEQASKVKTNFRVTAAPVAGGCCTPTASGKPCC